MTNYQIAKSSVAMVAVELKNTTVALACDAGDIATTGIAFTAEYTVRGTDKLQEYSAVAVAKLEPARVKSVNFLVARRAKQINERIAAKEAKKAEKLVSMPVATAHVA